MKLLVLSGGRHPYHESTPILGDFLSKAGHEVTITEDASVLAHAEDLRGYDALLFNTRRENLPDFGDLALSTAEQDGLKNFIRSGKAFICLHISTCLPKAWPAYHEITGGGWITGTSFHPPYGEFIVHVSAPGHPGVRGVSDFTTPDELYMGLALNDGNDVFLTGDAADGTHPWGPDRRPTPMPGGTFPLGWTRTYGEGKVFVLLLGHDGRSFQTPAFQQLVLNGVDWATAPTARKA
ncbi:MAG: ThuA domain-containing protein [Candidatus Entotheonellia bacterium]